MEAPENLANCAAPPFVLGAAGKAFETRLHQEAIREVHRALTRHFPEKNLQTYAHGRGWSSPTVAGEPVESEFQLRSVPVAVPMTDVIATDMAALSRYIQDIAGRFHGLAMGDLRATVEEVTERTGNVVSWGKGGQSAPDAFLEMIQKVEFGVDENGKVSLPSLLDPSPDFVAEIQRYQVEHPEFQQRVEELKAEKSAAALRREAERKARFKKAS